MTNIEILEAAAIISRSDSDPRRDVVRVVLNDYYKGIATIEDIEAVISKLTYHEFLEELKGKQVYRSLVDLYNNKLSDIRIAILLSSLLTHANIQLEMNDNLTPSQLRVYDMMDLLEEYYDTRSIKRRDVMEVVKSLGFIYQNER